MIKAIGVFRPEKYAEIIRIDTDDQKITSLNEPLTTTDEIIECLNKYGIEELQMLGPSIYTEHIGKEIQEKNLTKYNKAITIIYD